MDRDIDAALVEELRRLSGASNVTVGQDRRTVQVRPHPPLAGTRAAELGGVLRSAGRYGVRVSTTGDAPGGIHLRLDRWNRVVALDRERLCLVVQPQAATDTVLERLAGEGLCLPPDPCLAPGFWTGGENIGGYAATRRILGVEAVWPDGRPVRLGGPDGADQLELGLARLILGADGALGVVTTLYLRLGHPAPFSALLLAGFGRAEEARAALFALAGTPETAGSRLECLDLSLVAGSHTCENLRPLDGCGGALILEFSGAGPEVVEEAYARAGTLCREAGAVEVLAADNVSARQRVKKVREHYLTCAGSGRALPHLGGPVKREWLDLASAAGLTVPYCRLEGGTLCLALGGEGEGSRLSAFVAGLRRTSGLDTTALEVLARIRELLDPGAVLAAAGGII